MVHKVIATIISVLAVSPVLTEPLAVALAYSAVTCSSPKSCLSRVTIPIYDRENRLPANPGSSRYRIKLWEGTNNVDDRNEENHDSSVASITTSRINNVENEFEYPLDIPSPILLASSMVSAIAATGNTQTLLYASHLSCHFSWKRSCLLFKTGRQMCDCHIEMFIVFALRHILHFVLTFTFVVLSLYASRIGSVFELLEKKAVDGPIGTVGAVVVAALGFPLCLYLFFAAIQKAKVETAVDDEAYLRGK
jgi:hypothetical protein